VILSAMEFYRDSAGILYDVVKWHKRKKHAFIKGYLDIWVEYVKKNPPTLDIFDLYAASGLCYCPDCEKSGISEPSWEGSAILAARCLEEYKEGRYLFLNTFHPDPVIIKQQKDNLERILSQFKKIRCFIITCTIEEAIIEALKVVRPKYPNLWILDPHAASDLPWSIIEKIGNLKTPYKHKGRERTRKPELIITLMTSDLQRNVNSNPHVISTALGKEEAEWRPKFEDLIGKGFNTREAIIELYAEQLANLYEKPPIIAEIDTTEEAAIVYCMMLLTDHDAGYYVFKLKGLPGFEKWRITEWRKSAERISVEKRLPPGQTKLGV
jgi:three-Cys-motif partner protein